MLNQIFSKKSVVALTILLSIGAGFAPVASQAAAVVVPADKMITSIVEIVIFDKVSGSPVSTGSGISIGNSSILTNYHVVAELISQPNRFTAIVCVPSALGVDPICEYSASANEKFNVAVTPVYDASIDMAIININWQFVNRTWTKISSVSSDVSFLSLPAVSVKAGKAANVGDEVTTLGFPDFGHGKLMMSKGSVKDFTVNNGIKMIGTDAKIGHGSSGGAAFSKDGELLGITSGGNFTADGTFIKGFIIPLSAFTVWQKDLGSKAVTAKVTQSSQPKKSALAYTNLLQRTLSAK